MWIITRDKIEDGVRVGTIGPRDTEWDTAEKIKAHPKATRFRMRDDDNEIYYYGVAVLHDEADGFEPLDHFGMPNAGCTSIEYFENGKWSYN